MNQISKITNAQIIAELKSIAPSQFEKKFKGLGLEQISIAIAKAVNGLTGEQIQLGFATVWEKGFIPDPVLFRQWCLGNKDFTFADEIADSYVGKHGALANLEKWLESDGKTQISVAEKLAYDDSYKMWKGIANQADRTKAEMAFKDFYDKRVKEFVQNRIACQAYTPPVAIAMQEKQRTAVSNERALEILAQFKEKAA